MSFRKARKSLSRFRPFKRSASRRLHASSNEASIVSPLISSTSSLTSSSLDLDDEGNNQKSKLTKEQLVPATSIGDSRSVEDSVDAAAPPQPETIRSSPRKEVSDGSENEAQNHRFENSDHIMAVKTDNNKNLQSIHFNNGDHVKVVNHKTRHGMSGVIERQTKCFVFLEEGNTKEIIQIKPRFLALVVAGEILSGDKEIDKTPLESRLSSLPSTQPTEFSIKSTVVVVDAHTQHGGKVGTVQRHTAKFVVVIFLKDDNNKEFRISPQFLQHNGTNSDETDGTFSTITNSFHTASEFNGKSEREASNISKEGLASGLSMPFGFGKYPLERICLGKRNSNNIDSAFAKLWAGTSLTVEMPLDTEDELPMKHSEFGKEFELYYAQVGKKSSGYPHTPKKVTVHYVTSPNLREHEELLADFGSLTPNKVWARRKHFVSPGLKLKTTKQYAVKPIAANTLDIIDDVGTVGCGFISEQYLEELLGNNVGAKRALGIQVRIFLPTKGVFKGMLMRKRNMVHGLIELNDSLRKVAPSRRDGACENGYLVIKRMFPSTDNLQVGRLFQNPEDASKKKLTKTFKDGLKKNKSCNLSSMYTRVLEGLGVTDNMIKQYTSKYKNNPENLRHTHVVGMADPTNKLPPNTVFLTGTKYSDWEHDQLFVSRSPCMEAEDGRVVNVVRTKPNDMGHDEWEWLQSLHFGALIFGSPRGGERSLPELIAEGDLDGDLYFVLWDEPILSHIQAVPITDDELIAPSVETAKTRQYDPDWFNKTQAFISQVPCLHADIDRLVGELYENSMKFTNIQDSDAVIFARGYKQTLDMKKHGRPVLLPGHLWKEVSESLHKYLVSA